MLDATQVRHSRERKRPNFIPGYPSLGTPKDYRHLYVVTQVGELMVSRALLSHKWLRSLEIYVRFFMVFFCYPLGSW